MAARLVK